MYYSNENHNSNSGNQELMMFPGIPRTSSVNLYPENCSKSEIGKVFDYRPSLKIKKNSQPCSNSAFVYRISCIIIELPMKSGFTD